VLGTILHLSHKPDNSRDDFNALHKYSASKLHMYNNYYYLHQGGHVILGICPSVCLLATSYKTTDWIMIKISPNMYYYSTSLISMSFS